MYDTYYNSSTSVMSLNCLRFGISIYGDGFFSFRCRIQYLVMGKDKGGKICIAHSSDNYDKIS